MARAVGVTPTVYILHTRTRRVRDSGTQPRLHIKDEAGWNVEHSTNPSQTTRNFMEFVVRPYVDVAGVEVDFMVG